MFLVKSSISRLQLNNYLNAPLKIWILHQGPISELSLEEFVNRGIQQSLQLNIQIAEILENFVLARVLEIRFLAVWANGIRDVPVADLNGEVILRAIVAAAMCALQHGHHLNVKKASTSRTSKIKKQSN